LQAAGSASDRSLEHAALYALIESRDINGIMEGLRDERSSVRRAALLTLDQIEPSKITRDQVAPLLDTADDALLRTTLEVISKRSGWSDEIIGLVQPWLSDETKSADKQSMLRGVLLAFVGESAVQSLISENLSRDSLSPSSRQLLLDVIARSERDPIPVDWVDSIRQSLGSKDEATCRAAISAAARAISLLEPDLRKIILDATQPDDLRWASARHLAQGGASLDETGLQLLMSSLDSSDSVERMAAADALALAALSPPQQSKLIGRLEKAGPMELSALLRSFEKESSSLWADKLGETIASASARSTLSLARIDRLIERIPSLAEPLAPLRKDARERNAHQTASIDAIVAQVEHGNADRGSTIFFSAKASCSSCHRVDGKGGAIGPDLSKIGASRTVRDLAESVVLPSASLARGYESVRVLTNAGNDVVGVIARETLDAVWIRTADRNEVKIPRAEIDQMAPSGQSIMPEGLDRALSIEESADLMAYLLQQR
jgi:putative heme-binding domain-containing protein